MEFMPSLQAKSLLPAAEATKLAPSDGESFYPVQELSEGSSAAIEEAVKLCKERLSKDAMTILQLEELIAVAAENSPVSNKVSCQNKR